jgi:RimJ/RimL family protein N-acetyltransferase
MGIKKLKAGCYEKNIGSRKLLEKNKFKLEGILKSEYIFMNKRTSQYLFGRIL